MAVLAIAVLALGTYIFATSDDDPLPTEISEDVPGASPGATTVPPGATASPTPVATASPQLQVLVWSRERRSWQENDLQTDVPPHREGEHIGFAVQITDLTAGSPHEVRIHYQCRTPSGGAFDLLAGFEAAEADALNLTGRSRPDASIRWPDNTATPSSDGDSRLHLWGGTFESAPTSAAAAKPCEATREISFSITPLADVVFLIWSARLAPGAAAHEGPIGLEVSVDGRLRQMRNVSPEAIAP